MRLSKRRFLFLWLGIVAAGGVSLAVGAGKTLDRVIAKVNGEIVMASELAELLRERGGAAGAGDPVAAADPSTVRALFDRALLLDAAKRMSIDVAENEIHDQVEKMVDEIRARYPSERDFRSEVVAQYGSLDCLKRELARRATIDYKIERAVGRRFTISDADVERYEAECRAKGERPESYRLRRLGVAIDGETSQARKRALSRVKECLEAARAKGLSFAEAARRYTEIEAERPGGGDLGYLPAAKMDPELRQAVERLEPGQVTPPIVAGAYACIFYLEGKRGSRSSLYEKRFLEARQELLDELRRKASVTIYDERLARKLPPEYRACVQKLSGPAGSSRGAASDAQSTTPALRPSGAVRGAFGRLLAPLRRD